MTKTSKIIDRSMIAYEFPEYDFFMYALGISEYDKPYLIVSDGNELNTCIESERFMGENDYGEDYMEDFKYLMDEFKKYNTTLIFYDHRLHTGKAKYNSDFVNQNRGEN